MYSPKGVNDPTNPSNEGDSLDIHKATGRLTKPKSGLTLRRHKYTGPYNPIDKQLKYDKNIGQIPEIYDKPHTYPLYVLTMYWVKL